MKIKIVLILMAALLIFSGCKTGKQVTGNNKVRAISQVVSVMHQVQTNQPHFNTANVKMSLALDVTGRKVNVSANCKIRKDSAMFVSFLVFGLEVFKAELTPDSMKVIDKMNRKFYVVDYSFFNKRFGVDVDYYSLQSLFSAQLFCIGKKEVTADSCKLVIVSDTQKNIEFGTENLQQSTRLSALNVIQQVILKARNSNYQMQTTYTDYSTANGINFPQKITLVASGDNSNASCEFSILKADFNTDVKFQSTGTDRYYRGDIDQILKK
jgi:hypothetical protein